MIGTFLLAWAQADTGSAGPDGTPRVMTLIPDAANPTYPRLYPQAAPQDLGQVLHATYFVVEGAEMDHLKGPAGLARRLVQIDCWGYGDTGYGDVQQLWLAFKGTGSDAGKTQKLNGLRTALAGINVQCCRLVSGPRESYSPPQDAGDVGVHQLGGDFEFWFDD